MCYFLLKSGVADGMETAPTGVHTNNDYKRPRRSLSLIVATHDAGGMLPASGLCPGTTGGVPDLLGGFRYQLYRHQQESFRSRGIHHHGKGLFLDTDAQF